MSIPPAILRCASWLAPAEQRAEWLAEWRAELWYVQRASRCGSEVARFCLGAFQDALWLRWNGPRPLLTGIFRWESPLECLLFLAILAAGSWFLAFQLPGGTEIILPSSHRNAAELVLISGQGQSPDEPSTIPIEQYRAWAKGTPSRFTQMVFYQPSHWRVPISRYRSADLSLARAGGQITELFQIPVVSAVPALILSRTAWLKYFAGDAHIVGRVVDVDGQSATVASVLDERAWRLPGRVDAWLIEDEDHLAQIPPSARGFVLAHFRAPALHPPSGIRHLVLPGLDGAYRNYDCVSLPDPPPNLAGALLLMALATCLVVQAGPSLALGGFRTLRQATFLSAKIMLLLPIVVLGSFDLAYSIALFAHLHFEAPLFLAAWILGARWLLRDQQQRCPVCLRLLGNPVGIGQASQTFLGWYGTELMCAKGHGLLQVPEIPTSSSSTSQWIQLDPSWSGLF